MTFDDEIPSVINLKQEGGYVNTKINMSVFAKLKL